MNKTAKINYFDGGNDRERLAGRILSARARAKSFRLASLLIALASIIPVFAIIHTEIQAQPRDTPDAIDLASSVRPKAKSRGWIWLWVALLGSSGMMYLFSLQAQRKAELLRKPY